jgi:hypothetical protein
MLYPELLFVVSITCFAAAFFTASIPELKAALVLFASPAFAISGLILTALQWNSIERRRKTSIVVLAICSTTPAVFMFVSTLLPSHPPLSELPRRGMCKANLKNIALGLHQYAQDHAGALPPSLEQLVEKGYVSPNSKVFVCPSHWTHKQPKETLNSSYDYFGPNYRAGVPTNTVMLMDRFKHPAHKHLPSGWFVVTLDFEVRFVTDQEPASVLLPSRGR